MKYLGDSIVAARYEVDGNTVTLQATGDPTFLHADFKNQPLYNFLKQDWVKEVELNTKFNSEPLGRGWAWDDYSAEYMAERDPFPMYGNIATFIFSGETIRTIPQSLRQAVVGVPELNKAWSVERNIGGRFFTIANGRGTTAMQKTITMSMDKGAFATRYLTDTLHKLVTTSYEALPITSQKIYSQPVDSLLKIMMHRSDNFFAEQTLLMVSNEVLGQMNDRRISDSLLNADFKDMPQKAKWFDGSGLSRYNLFSPQDFVWLLNKMKNEFGLDRMKEILPTGGEGTLSSLYKNYTGRIYAKTGTLSNHVALSGYVLTKKNKVLIFSVLANNQLAASANIRKAIERFVTSIIDKY
jgi:D-alanyl-D-alanine carboxypeptidase/D-alanyl-D-alanine-endopeptidase (penicillin-binding protein 4)